MLKKKRLLVLLIISHANLPTARVSQTSSIKITCAWYWFFIYWASTKLGSSQDKKTSGSLTEVVLDPLKNVFMFFFYHGWAVAALLSETPWLSQRLNPVGLRLWWLDQYPGSICNIIIITGRNTIIQYCYTSILTAQHLVV